MTTAETLGLVVDFRSLSHPRCTLRHLSEEPSRAFLRSAPDRCPAPVSESTRCLMGVVAAEGPCPREECVEAAVGGVLNVLPAVVARRHEIAVWAGGVSQGCGIVGFSVPVSSAACQMRFRAGRC